MKRSELFFTAAQVPLDFLMIVLAAMLSYFLRFTDFMKGVRQIMFYLPFSKFILLILAIAPFWILIFTIVGLYSIKKKKRFLNDFYGAFLGVSAGIMGVIIFIFLRAELFASRFLLLAWWFFAILFITCGRFFLRSFQKYLFKYGIGVHRLVLLGENPAAICISECFNKIYSGYKVVAHLNGIDNSIVEKLRKISQTQGIDDVIQTDPDFPKGKMIDIIDFAYENKIDFKFIPDLFGAKSTNIDLDVLSGYPIVELKRTPLDDWGRIFKRIFDFAGALLGLILTSPLFLIVALAIKLDSRGPVFVRLKRVGKNEIFHLYKFRSMVKDAHLMKKDLLKYSERRGLLFKMKDDPRITRVGKIIRRLRIDEIPQLINVLLNNISIIGPRPHEPEEVALYEKHHRKVLLIKPGITGMAQACGSADLDFEDEVKLDTYYIENWTPALDFQILFRTLVIVFSGVGAY